MALIKCPECHGVVSTKAPACPHCGLAVTSTPKNSAEVITPVDLEKAAPRTIAAQWTTPPIPRGMLANVASVKAPWWRPLASAAKITGWTAVGWGILLKFGGPEFFLSDGADTLGSATGLGLGGVWIAALVRSVIRLSKKRH